LTISSLALSEQVADRLAPYIGQFNARMWVKSAARRELGLLPEDLRTEHVAALMDGLRTALSTLMGRAAADDLLLQIRREVS